MSLVQAFHRSPLAAFAIAALAAVTACSPGEADGEGGGDAQRPFVTGTAPEANAANVSREVRVRVVFSEEIDPSSITRDSIQLVDGSGSTGTRVHAVVSYELGTKTAVLHPQQPLSYLGVYTILVTQQVRDRAGNPLQAQFQVAFSVEAEPDLLAPTIVEAFPVFSASDVDPAAAISVRFSEAMAPTSIGPQQFTVAVAGTPIAGAITYDAEQLRATFVPAAPLSYATEYAVEVTGVVDLAGNGLASPWRFSFTTRAAPDTVPPEVASTSPEAGGVNVLVRTAVEVLFTEPLLESSVLAAAQLQCAGATVPFTAAYEASTHKLVLTPSSRLLYSATCELSLGTGIRDLAGNALAGTRIFSFTTEADTEPPGVEQITPTASATGVEPAAEVTVRFNEPMRAESLAGSSFQLTIDGAPIGGTVTYDPATRTARFAPTSLLPHLRTVGVTVSTGVQDLAGNALAAPFSSSFTTRDWTWSAPRKLSVGSNPQVGAAADGTAMAVWQSYTDTYKLYQSTLDPATDTWSSAAACEGLLATTVDPEMAMGADGTAALVWTARAGSIEGIQGRVRRAGASGWGEIRSILYSGGATLPPRVAVSSTGKVAAALAQSDGHKYDLFVSRYDAATDGWTYRTPVESTTEDVRRVDGIAVDAAGNVLVVWVQRGADYVDRLYGNRYSAQSDSWGGRFELGVADGGARGALVMAPGSDALVAWQPNLFGDMTSRYYSAETNTWSAPQSFTVPDGDYAAGLELAMDGAGNVVASWHQEDGTWNSVDHVWANRFTPADGRWGTPQRLDDEPYSAQWARLAVDPQGNAVVLWWQSDGSRSRTWYARFDVDTGLWGSPSVLSAPSAGDKDVAFDGLGRAIAVWEQPAAVAPYEVWTSFLE